MSLVDVFRKVIDFLNREKFDYFLLGGMAVGVIGEPRATVDVDIDIALDKKDISMFLKKTGKAGFQFSERECIKRARETGTFQVRMDDYHIDFIIASIELEKEAFKRKKVMKIHGVKSNLPTPEDLMLLKIVAGRLQDIVDAEKIAQRYSGKLDEKYLLRWAEKLSDEAEDLRIYKEAKRLLKL